MSGEGQPKPDEVEPSCEKCRVLYEYTSDGPNQLSIKPDDIIVLHHKVDDEWWQGELNGLVGFFPCAYVEIIAEPVVKVAKVLYSFSEPGEGRIALQANDIVSVLETDDPDWWLVKQKTSVGYFPKDYLEPVSEEMLSESAPGTHSATEVAPANTPSQDSTQGDSVSSPSETGPKATPASTGSANAASVSAPVLHTPQPPPSQHTPTQPSATLVSHPPINKDDDKKKEKPGRKWTLFGQKKPHKEEPKDKLPHKDEKKPTVVVPTKTPVPPSATAHPTAEVEPVQATPEPKVVVEPSDSKAATPTQPAAHISPVPITSSKPVVQDTPQPASPQPLTQPTTQSSQPNSPLLTWQQLANQFVVAFSQNWTLCQAALQEQTSDGYSNDPHELILGCLDSLNTAMETISLRDSKQQEKIAELEETISHLEESWDTELAHVREEILSVDTQTSEEPIRQLITQLTESLSNEIAMSKQYEEIKGKMNQEKTLFTFSFPDQRIRDLESRLSLAQQFPSRSEPSLQQGNQPDSTLQSINSSHWLKKEADWKTKESELHAIHAKLREEKLANEKEISTLKADLAAAISAKEKALETVKLQRDERDNALTQREALSGQLREAAEREKGFSAALAEAKQDAQRCASIAEQTQQEMGRARQEKLQHEKQISELTKELEDANKYKHLSDQSAMELQRVKQLLDFATCKCEEAENRYSTLFSKHQEGLQALTQAQNDLHKLEVVARGLENTNASLEVRLKAAEPQIAEIPQLRAMLNTAAEEKAQANALVADLQTKSSQEKARSAAEKEQLTHMIEELHKQCISVHCTKTELQQLKQIKEKLEAENKVLTEKTSSFDESLSSLQTSLKSAQSELQHTTDQLHLAQVNKGSSTDQQVYEQIIQRHRDSEKQCNDLRNELEAANKRLDEQAKATSMEEARFQTLKDQNSAQVHTLETQIDELKKSLDAESTKQQDHLTKLKDGDLRFGELQQRLNARNDEMESLKKQLEESNRSKQQLEEKCATLSQQVDFLKRRPDHPQVPPQTQPATQAQPAVHAATQPPPTTQAPTRPIHPASPPPSHPTTQPPAHPAHPPATQPPSHPPTQPPTHPAPVTTQPLAQVAVQSPQTTLRRGPLGPAPDTPTRTPAKTQLASTDHRSALSDSHIVAPESASVKVVAEAFDSIALGSSKGSSAAAMKKRPLPPPPGTKPPPPTSPTPAASSSTTAAPVSSNPALRHSTGTSNPGTKGAAPPRQPTTAPSTPLHPPGGGSSASQL
ncbi:E3 ubiquitin-protein ligase SH3RF [Pelomyxa schiedti]|nr:E3 ubiquitin-protein ligase SH3RF [Pelomyxa schiedti]